MLPHEHEIRNLAALRPGLQQNLWSLMGKDAPHHYRSARRHVVLYDIAQATVHTPRQERADERWLIWL
jgi:hypothetical protein